MCLVIVVPVLPAAAIYKPHIEDANQQIEIMWLMHGNTMIMQQMAKKRERWREKNLITKEAKEILRIGSQRQVERIVNK